MHILKRFALNRKSRATRTTVIVMFVALTMLLLSQTVFARTTYVITDGSRVLIHTTTATDPAAVLGEAGLELGENDTYTAQVIPGLAEIKVQRNQTISIDYYGEVMEASSFGETVQELLTRLNLSWGGEDTVSLPLNTETYDGMTLTVSNVIRQDQTYTTNIAHETIYCDDTSMPAGTERVITAGVDGQMVCDATVTYINGVESERLVHTEKVVTQPVSEVVAVGRGDQMQKEADKAMPVIGDGIIYLPTGEVLTYSKTSQVSATAYTHTDPGCNFYTATGSRVRMGTVAVDPRYIPYGTRMFIVSNDGSYIYGVSEAEDCGGAIKGSKIDLYFPTYNECIQFGRRNCTVYFLD